MHVYDPHCILLQFLIYSFHGNAIVRDCLNFKNIHVTFERSQYELAVTEVKGQGVAGIDDHVISSHGRLSASPLSNKQHRNRFGNWAFWQLTEIKSLSLSLSLLINRGVGNDWNNSHLHLWRFSPLWISCVLRFRPRIFLANLSFRPV